MECDQHVVGRYRDVHIHDVAARCHAAIERKNGVFGILAVTTRMRDHQWTTDAKRVRDRGQGGFAEGSVGANTNEVVKTA